MHERLSAAQASEAPGSAASWARVASLAATRALACPILCRIHAAQNFRMPTSGRNFSVGRCFRAGTVRSDPFELSTLKGSAQTPYCGWKFWAQRLGSSRNRSERFQCKAHGAREPQGFRGTEGFRAPSNAAIGPRSKFLAVPLMGPKRGRAATAYDQKPTDLRPQ